MLSYLLCEGGGPMHKWGGQSNSLGRQFIQCVCENFMWCLKYWLQTIVCVSFLSHSIFYLPPLLYFLSFLLFFLLLLLLFFLLLRQFPPIQLHIVFGQWCSSCEVIQWSITSCCHLARSASNFLIAYIYSMLNVHTGILPPSLPPFVPSLFWASNVRCSCVEFQEFDTPALAY